MMSRTTIVQLAAFSVVTVASVGYGAATLFNADRITSPPYLVEAQFEFAGGIYPRADVDLLGTNVGEVRELRPGPGAGTTVVMAIDEGVEIPKDVNALIGSKSAIGEQYVELAPQSADAPMLGDGDVITLDRTKSPVDFAEVLANLQGLAASVPPRSLATVLDELSTAVQGLGPTMGRLIDDSDTVTRASLEGVEELNQLIDAAAVVLDTQVAKSGATTTYLRELGELTMRLRELNPEVAAALVEGVRAGTGVTNLLRDNQDALPVLLNNLIAVNQVAHDRIPALRKMLVVFPWILEIGGTGIRYCDELNPTTGRPVEATCHYDEQGRPIYAAYLGFQLAEAPGTPPHLPCVKGYEGTQKYYPNGSPVNGSGRQRVDSPPNMNARCAAPPTDPVSPNVRGAQNAHDYTQFAGRAAPWGLALYDPATGTVVAPDGFSYVLRGTTGDAPPSGDEGLEWLLTHPMTGSTS